MKFMLHYSRIICHYSKSTRDHSEGVIILLLCLDVIVVYFFIPFRGRRVGSVLLFSISTTSFSCRWNLFALYGLVCRGLIAISSELCFIF